MLNKDTIQFIQSKAYKEIEKELLDYASRYFKLSFKDTENLQFTEQLMKEYAVKKAEACFKNALINIHLSIKKKELSKISWK